MSSLFYYEPFYDFERFVDDALTNRLLTSGNNNQQLQRQEKIDNSGAMKTMRPRMDLHEDNDKNQVTATFELPGLKKDDVQIDVHNNRLTIQGESKVSDNYNENGWAVRERRFGKFSRTLQLPQGVKDKQIKASMDNGVLTVMFPKASPEDAPKKITVS